MTNADAAALFQALADQLKAQGATTFGGAFLAVPPAGTSLDAILLTSTPDQALFWATVEGKIAIAKAEIDAQSHGMMGRRR